MLRFNRASYTREEFPFPCSHELYKDSDGYYVLHCKSVNTQGGVAVNDLALEHLQRLTAAEPEKAQLHLTHAAGWAWEGTLAELPYKDSINANHSRYPGSIRIYDRVDLHPAHLPFASRTAAPPPPPPMPGPGRALVPVRREISFEVLKTKTHSTFTNPSLSVLTNLSILHPFDLEITEGRFRIYWRGE